MSTDLLTEALARQEEIIERGLTSFLEVGDALQKIRSDRLYLLTHATFAAYCLERWGFSDSRAYQLVKAAEVVSTIVGTGLPVPATESQARELAKVPGPERAEVWAETLERTDGKPTAAAIREVAAADPAPAPPVQHSAPVADPDPEVEAEHRRRQVIRTARKTAERIAATLRVDVVAIVAGIEFGERGLITPDLVADLRAAVEVLAEQLAAESGEA